MKCYINNDLVIRNNIGVRQFGFGKDINNKDGLKYLIILPISEFTIIVQPIFDSYIQTMKEDDERLGIEPDDEDSVYMNERGYPNYMKVITEDKNFMEMFIWWHFKGEILDSLFNNNDKSNLLYVINSLDSITIKEDTVEVRGEAFEIKRSN